MNFNNSYLDLSDVTIEKNNDSILSYINPGYVIVTGLNLAVNETKTVYVDRQANSDDYLCVKHTELSSIIEISKKCDQSTEKYLYCAVPSEYPIGIELPDDYLKRKFYLLSFFRFF